MNTSSNLTGSKDSTPLEAAETNRDAKRLEKAAEDERLARVKIEAALAARHITPEQQRAIGITLAKYGGQIVFIRSNSGDEEAKTLALEMKVALEHAHRRVEDRTGQPLGGEALLGIHVECVQGQRGFAEALVHAFRAEGGLAVVPLPPYSCGLNVTDISVGQKPLPELNLNLSNP